jgi:hypothetical protein
MGCKIRVFASAGFPARLPSRTGNKVLGWERDNGAVEEISS